MEKYGRKVRQGKIVHSKPLPPPTQTKFRSEPEKTETSCILTLINKHRTLLSYALIFLGLVCLVLIYLCLAARGRRNKRKECGKKIWDDDGESPKKRTRDGRCSRCSHCDFDDYGNPSFTRRSSGGKDERNKLDELQRKVERLEKDFRMEKKRRQLEEYVDCDNTRGRRNLCSPAVTHRQKSPNRKSPCKEVKPILKPSMHLARCQEESPRRKHKDVTTFPNDNFTETNDPLSVSPLSSETEEFPLQIPMKSPKRMEPMDYRSRYFKSNNLKSW